MATMNPYLNLAGNTEEAFNFYKSVFGGEFASFMKFKNMPESEKMSPEDQEKIMHVSLPISEGHILMGSDSLESMGQKLNMGNNFYISLSPGSKEEADKLFNGLSEGGKVEMPMQDTFWEAYFGMFADKFGVQWMINYQHKK